MTLCKANTQESTDGRSMKVHMLHNNNIYFTFHLLLIQSILIPIKKIFKDLMTV